MHIETRSFWKLFLQFLLSFRMKIVIHHSFSIFAYFVFWKFVKVFYKKGKCFLWRKKMKLRGRKLSLYLFSQVYSNWINYLITLKCYQTINARFCDHLPNFSFILLVRGTLRIVSENRVCLSRMPSVVESRFWINGSLKSSFAVSEMECI